MSKRGQRSQTAKQKRQAKKIINQNSYYDKKLKERINTITQQQLYNTLKKTNGYVPIGITKKWEQGEVLADCRGKGTQQCLKAD